MYLFYIFIFSIYKEFIIFTDPNSKYAYDAQYYLAESKFYLEQYKEALNEFESYLSLPIRDKDLSAKAEFMICKCWYHSTNEILKDQSNTDIALEKLQYYIEKESMIYYVDEISRMIFSLRKKMDSNVMITGAIKKTAVASA